jgi:hypothetical protein
VHCTLHFEIPFHFWESAQKWYGRTKKKNPLIPIGTVGLHCCAAALSILRFHFTFERTLKIDMAESKRRIHLPLLVLLVFEIPFHFWANSQNRYGYGAFPVLRIHLP